MGSHSNWPSDFAELKKLEDILQCSICYEYIDTCMITTCSHNFCSLCIRRYLQFKPQCPTCFEENHGVDLRKNRLIDEVIAIWLKVKDLLLFNVRLAAMTQSVKVEPKQCDGVESPEKHTKVQGTERKDNSKSVKKELATPKIDKGKKGVVQKLFSEKKTTPESTESKTIVVDGIVIPSIFQPQKSPKKIAKKNENISTCPVCNVDIPSRNVNLHLDSCLAASDPASSRLKPKPEKRNPIPKRVYSLMKEKDLKKCLKDYGLSTNGDRKAMIARVNRYIVLYNAECDKEEPRPVSDLLKQVEREERDEKATQSNPLFQSTRPPTIPPDKKKDPEAIEKANKEYLVINRDNFKKLIENMKARDGMNIKPLKPLNRIGSDDEDEEKPIANGYAEAPTCSKVDKDVISICSQDTVVGSDSEIDMLDKSPVKSEPGCSKAGLINWEKTGVKDESELDTQVIDDSKEKDSVLLQRHSDDDSNSYDSVFNTSSVSEGAKTPKSKLTLSARKRSKVNICSAESPSTSKKMVEKFAEIFEADIGVEGSSPNKSTLKKSDDENSLVNGHAKGEADETEDEVNEEAVNESDGDDDTSDESEEEDDEFPTSVLRTPTKNHDVSPEISPMKTRSAKRKSGTLGEKTPTSESTATRRKRMKPSASPVY